MKMAKENAISLNNILTIYAFKPLVIEGLFF